MDSARFRWRNLPHWEIAGATYFVTFRLAGSLPAAVVEEWRRDRERLLRSAGDRQLGTALTDWKAQARLSCQKFDAQLDCGAFGPKHLGDPNVANLVVNALRFHDGHRYELAAYVVMPNHVHMVIRPLEKPNSQSVWGLDELMHSIKGFTGNKANALLSLHGEFWQREYNDHLIRDEEEWIWYVDYTHANPVKAGFCAKPEDWEWSSARDLPVDP